MYRIASYNNAAVKPARPADVNTPGYFQNGTEIDFGWMNTIQEEVAKAIENSRLTLDAGDDEQLYTAIKTLGGRTWWRSMAWLNYGENAAPVDLTVTENADAGYVAYVVSGAAPDNDSEGHYLCIPLDIRGLRVEAAQLTYKTIVAFDGSSVARTLKLYHIGADGTSTEIGSLTLDLTTTPSNPVTTGLTMSSNPIPSAGGSLVAVLKLSRTGASVGTLRIYNFSVQFEEGHE